LYKLHHSRIALFAVAGLAIAPQTTPTAQAQPRGKPGAPATRADVERLDKKIEEQQRRLDKLIALQLQYLQALAALSDGAPPPAAADARSPEPADAPRPPDKPPAADVRARPAVVSEPPRPRPVAAEPRPVKPRPDLVGNVVGKVTGAADAVIYVDDIVAATRGSAEMKQENKQFSPSVLVVQKGTTVQFPNLDAIFHNVFSVSPDHTFDLGNYPKGESKGVAMTKPGVVSVYCNMHPQMVGHILVVPNGNFVRAGKDGFFRLTNVPVGRHRIVAWAPNARPVATEAEVSDAEPVTVELELKKLRTGPHLKKDGLPYGSYEK
jgi:plastocyanin